ncbi:MAG: hypothetical protein IPG12_14150 [Saprospiraceae bacterium]|nr:hypothetical protein [Saprospiraceae bacterium]
MLTNMWGAIFAGNSAVEGGGVADLPLTKETAKDRRFQTNNVTIPAGALVINIYNPTLNDLQLSISAKPVDPIAVGSQYSFESSINLFSKRQDVSQPITCSSPNGELFWVYVKYPQSDPTDPFTL